jgi:azurin
MKKLFLAVIALALVTVGCAGGADKKTAEKKETTEAKAEKPVEKKEEANADVPEVIEVVIEGNDQMKYNLDKIEVYAGQKVKLTLKHVGEMPKASMGHNWVLLHQGVERANFAMDAMKAKDNDYIPNERKADIIVHTIMLGGGEQTTIEFEAPKKGTYEFLCSFPGHHALMNGKFIVK